MVTLSVIYPIDSSIYISPIDFSEWKGFSDDILDKISLDEYLLKIVENFKAKMKEGLPNINIPVLDPFRPPEINVDENDDKVNFQLIIRNITVLGLSKFSIDYLETSLKHLNLSFIFRLPELIASGYYYMNGKYIKIVPLRGNGSWSLEMDNLTLSAYAALDTTEDNKYKMGDKLEARFDFEAVRMKFENLMGNGKWVQVVIKILNDLARKLFNKFQPLLINPVKDKLREIVDTEFNKLSIKAIKPGSTANEYVDQIIDNVREQLYIHNLEPMELPDYVYNFSQKVFFFTTEGEAKLYEGLLEGASSIHRTGDCIINATDEVAVVGANLGLKDLKINYKGHAKLMGKGPSIECGGSLAEVAFYMEIEQPNSPGSNPTLTAFEITHMSTIWIELTGLGPLTWIMKWLLTGVTKLMEHFIIDKVTGYIKEYVESQLSKVSFPIGY